MLRVDAPPPCYHVPEAPPPRASFPSPPVVSVALVTVLQNSREKVIERGGVKKVPLWQKFWSIRGRRSPPAGSSVFSGLWSRGPGTKSELYGSGMPCVLCIAAGRTTITVMRMPRIRTLPAPSSAFALSVRAPSDDGVLLDLCPDVTVKGSKVVDS